MIDTLIHQQRPANAATIAPTKTSPKLLNALQQLRDDRTLLALSGRELNKLYPDISHTYWIQAKKIVEQE